MNKCLICIYKHKISKNYTFVLLYDVTNQLEKFHSDSYSLKMFPILPNLLTTLPFNLKKNMFHSIYGLRLLVYDSGGY